MHTLQNKKNKDQFLTRKRDEKRGEKEIIFCGGLKGPLGQGALRAPRPTQYPVNIYRISGQDQHNSQSPHNIKNVK